MARLISFTFLCALLVSFVHARPWTANGKTIEAELVGYESSKGIVWLQEKWKKPIKVNLDALDFDSRIYVIENKAGLVEYKGIMFTKAEKEKREKLDFQKENPPYVFDPKRIHSMHDDFDGYTTYEAESAPAVNEGENYYAVLMRAFQKGTNNVFVSIVGRYTGRDWIFVHNVTLLGANGLKFAFTDDDPRHEVNNYSDGVSVDESVSSILTEKDLKLVESILLSGRVRVRYSSNSSNGYIVDWEMRGYQKRSCLDIINAFKKLRAIRNAQKEKKESDTEKLEEK